MSLAVSKGGVYGTACDPKGFEIDIVRQWHDVGQKKVSGATLYQNLVQIASPIQLEVGIGNTCGLQCEHCFLGYDSGTMLHPLTPMPILLKTVTDLVTELGTRMICVTDRDALTPNRSIPLFRETAELRTRYPTLKFGGVTNGLAIHKYVEDLEQIHLDYLDISIDGSRYEHDRIRGKGKFDLVFTNLLLALECQLAERIIVATTLTQFNDDSILQMIHKLIFEGVQWFDINPLLAVKMQQYQLRERDIVIFLESLFKSLQPVQVARPVTILMELCAYCAAFLPALIDYGWLIPEKIRQDRYGHLYQDIEVNDSIKITLRPELIPEYWRHTLRISADGYVIGGCEPLTQADYRRSAIGNIQTESIYALYAKALTPDSPFHHTMLSYDRSGCRDKPCFAHCLGGDPLLAKSVYGDYNVKDPNCAWFEYEYQGMQPEVNHQDLFCLREDEN
jgi:MoaA/NifB/PqqE/SkfB family radical SAM enzyme